MSTILLYRNLLTGFSPVFITVNILFPGITIYVGGYSYSTLLENGTVKVSGIYIPYTAFLASGFIGYNVLWTCILSGTIIWNDRRNGMFDQIMGMPFTRFQYVLSNILTILLMGMIGAAVILVVGLPALINYVHITFLGILYILFAIVSCSIIFSSVVLTISISIVKIETLSFQLEAGFIYGLFLFLTLGSTIYYTEDSLTEPIATIVSLNPLTHFLNIIRDSLFNQISNKTIIELLILGSISCAALLGGIIALRYTNTDIGN